MSFSCADSFAPPTVWRATRGCCWMPCTVTRSLLTQAPAVERLWEISTPPLRGEFTDAVMMRDYDRLASLWSPAGGRT